MLKKRYASNRGCVSNAGLFVSCMAGAVLVVISALLPATNAAAQSTTVEFDIPAQPVASALRAYAHQARVQLLVLTEGLEAIQANAVVGRLDPQTALQVLLAGTGLQAQYRPDATVAVGRESDSSTGPVSSANSDIHSNMVARANDEADAQTKGDTLQIRQNSASLDPDEGRNWDALIEEIVVTGSNIRGVEAVGAASVTFTRAELDHAGFSTVQELFEALPQNLDEVTIDGVSAEGVSIAASENAALASGISLRGLGPGSTLVLLNGKRRPTSVNGRVVDVSAIPLSMIERVEMVTGGRSAVYGSDAVAGVVNIVTRTAFDGANTQLYYGAASAGAEQFNFSHAFGAEFDRGGFVVGYDYRKEQALDATDAGVARGPSRFGITPIPGLWNMRAPSEQHVGLFAGHYVWSENAELYADMHFSSDENEGGRVFDFLGQFDGGGTFVTDSNQYSAVGGVRLDVGNDWQFDVSALHGVADNAIATASLLLPAGTVTSLDEIEPQGISEKEATLTSFSAKADGPLGQLWDETVSGAIGVHFRNESFERTRIDFAAGTTEPREDLDRNVWSIFGEVYVPLTRVNDRRLEVSLAARYDNYGDFGSTLNPQLGIEWQPVDGLTLRGSFSTAFRAPDLFALGFSNEALVRLVDDPLAPGTTAALFTETGGNRDLQPEEADSYTLGIGWEPSDRSKLSLSYFAIEYEGRIDVPSESDTTALQDEMLLGTLIDRNPTPDELNVVLNRATRLINLGLRGIVWVDIGISG
jgi:outer membrane receptor protein involved in Fe transport